MSLLIPAAIGGALLLLASSKPKSSSPGASPGVAPGERPPSAADYQTRIAEALSRGDADELMRVADAMQADGLVAEAQALRTVALNLKNLGALGSSSAPKPPAGSAPPASPGLPVILPSPAIPSPPNAAPPVVQPTPAVIPAPQPAPSIVFPPVVAPSPVPIPAGVSVTPEQQRRLSVAQAMVMNLRNTSRYQENQQLVIAFQKQEGKVPDGKYGPKTGLAVAALGIVPPRPRYWSSKTMQADKRQWTDAMNSFAATDPARAADWRAAGQVANDPVK